MEIYKITNKINGKVYIGQTKQPVYTRWSQHKCRSKTGNSKINRAIRKYGYENFTIETIDNAENYEELNKKEIMWIKQYDCIKGGYNIEEGGWNAPMSQESKDELSKKQKESYKNGRVPSFLGKKHTEETREIMSKSSKNRTDLKGNDYKLGKTHTKEFKEKCRKRMVGNTHRRRAIRCLNNNVIYESVVKACEELGLDNRSLHRVLKGEWKHTKQYKFEYAD